MILTTALLTPQQLQNLQEVINIGVGFAASVLHDLTKAPVELTIPRLELKTVDDSLEIIDRAFGVDLVSAVQLGFQGPLEGNGNLVLPKDAAHHLVEQIVPLDGEEVEGVDLHIETLAEVGNILINGLIGAIANLMGKNVIYSLPNYIEMALPKLIETITHEEPENHILVAQSHFSIPQRQLQGDFIVVFRVGSVEGLTQALNHYLTPEPWENGRSLPSSALPPLS